MTNHLAYHVNKCQKSFLSATGSVRLLLEKSRGADGGLLDRLHVNDIHPLADAHVGYSIILSTNLFPLVSQPAARRGSPPFSAARAGSSPFEYVCSQEPRTMCSPGVDLLCFTRIRAGASVERHRFLCSARAEVESRRDRRRRFSRRQVHFVDARRALWQWWTLLIRLHAAGDAGRVLRAHTPRTARLRPADASEQIRRLIDGICSRRYPLGAKMSCVVSLRWAMAIKPPATRSCIPDESWNENADRVGTSISYKMSTTGVDGLVFPSRYQIHNRSEKFASVARRCRHRARLRLPEPSTGRRLTV